jgi:hypothetical protein
VSLEWLEVRLVPSTFPVADLHAAGEYMRQLINAARADPAGTAARFGIDLNEGLPPGTISAAAKPPLAPNGALLQSIDGHLPFWLAKYTDPFADDIHSGLGDGTWMTRAQAAGYSNPMGTGENLWSLHDTAPLDLQASVDLMFRKLFVDADENTPPAAIARTSSWRLTRKSARARPPGWCRRRARTPRPART